MGDTFDLSEEFSIQKKEEAFLQEMEEFRSALQKKMKEAASYEIANDHKNFLQKLAKRHFRISENDFKKLPQEKLFMLDNIIVRNAKRGMAIFFAIQSVLGIGIGITAFFTSPLVCLVFILQAVICLGMWTDQSLGVTAKNTGFLATRDSWLKSLNSQGEEEEKHEVANATQ